MFSNGVLGCLALKVRYEQHLSMWSFALAAMWGQRRQSSMRSSKHSRPRCPTSSWYPLWVTSLCKAGKTSWKRVSSDSLGLAFLYRTPFGGRRWFHLCKNWFRRICLSGLLLPQDSILQSRKDQTQGWICLLGLMPVFQGHTGDLLTVLHWLHDMQITTLCLYGACGAFEGSFLHSSHCCSCDLWVTTWVVRHASQPGHPQ